MRNGGSQAFNEHNSTLFDEVVARTCQFCDASAILFRISVRIHIISSKTIQYGYNDAQEFITIITSEGIRDMVLLASNCYDSLRGSSAQDRIRPQILQILTVLMSLLNDDNSRELSSRIKSSFGIPTDRKSMELLFLKVSPLRSKTPEIFLHHMILSYEPPNIEPPKSDNYSHYWDFFLGKIDTKRVLSTWQHTPIRSQSTAITGPQSGTQQFPFPSLELSKPEPA